MPNTKRHESDKQGHLSALKNKHNAMKIEIENCKKHPSVSDEVIRSMKIDKLRIKDEIEKESKRASSSTH
jgi:hypothetical protein